MMSKKRKQPQLGNVNFLGRPVAFNHKHSQPIFGFSPMKSRPAPKIEGYTGINMFSSIAIPQRQSVSLWGPHSRPGAAMWGDKDGDGVYNGFDCQPNNRFKQGKEHGRSRKPRFYGEGNVILREQKILAHHNAIIKDADKLVAEDKEQMRTGSNRLSHDADDMVMPLGKAKIEREFQPVGFPKDENEDEIANISDPDGEWAQELKKFEDTKHKQAAATAERIVEIGKQRTFGKTKEPEYDYEEELDKIEGKVEQARLREHEGED
jgi:hypothetical protein